jgi:hypothetical protein
MGVYHTRTGDFGFGEHFASINRVREAEAAFDDPFLDDPA